MLEVCYSIVLQHVQEGCLSGIVKTREDSLAYLFKRPRGGEDSPDCTISTVSASVKKLKAMEL